MSDAIKILVIDDNKEFVTGLRLLLAKDNCSFYEAYNGPDGIKTASEVQPDLILLDIVMPGIDGYETLRRIKSNPLTSDSFVVMLSGIRTSTEDQAHGLETGSDGYITRPVSNRELLARIRTFIRLKKSEKNLSQSEEKYRMLFKNLILGYAHHKIISDDNGSPVDYVILEVNPEFEKLTGLKASEITGKSVMEIFPETEPYWIENYGEVAIKGKEMRFVEYSSVLKKHFEVFAFSPEPGFFSTLFYDVTDRHKNEELIKGYNTELQKNNLAKDKLFSIISHDIKGPFGAFVGLLEVLEEDIDNIPPTELKSVIAGMRHSAGNLQNLLENLLHWSRLQMDKLSFEPRVLRLKEIAGNCLELFENQAQKKMISLSNMIDDHIWVHADKDMLEVILRNLISNAVKYTEKNGEVSLSARETGDGSCLIKVSDNGIGMNHEILQNLFTLDAEASRFGTGDEPGTGLGLILCKEFVEKHGGNLEVKSIENQGSEFYFTLPLPEKQPGNTDLRI